MLCEPGLELTLRHIFWVVAGPWWVRLGPNERRHLFQAVPRTEVDGEVGTACIHLGTLGVLELGLQLRVTLPNLTQKDLVHRAGRLDQDLQDSKLVLRQARNVGDQLGRLESGQPFGDVGSHLQAPSGRRTRPLLGLRRAPCENRDDQDSTD